MSAIGWPRVEVALSTHQPRPIEGPQLGRAAVALLLREAGAGLELLFILRADRENDPWSGQVGFPGGRAEEGDQDPVATAVRETFEEIGLRLSREAHLIGRLDDIQAMAQMRPLDLVITPVLFRVEGDIRLRPNREVRSVHWYSLESLFDPVSGKSFDYTHQGVTKRMPCLELDSLRIWGLTYRMLEGLRQLLA
jgi:8-oxo-dGTP pyrophosphatase MutT (NUDIX family)